MVISLVIMTSESIIVLLQWPLCMMDTPLSIVEHKFTRKLLLESKVKEHIKIHNHMMVQQKKSLSYVMLFETFKDLDSNVSLTYVIWIACTSREYLTLTAHYIDKECLKPKVLNFTISLLHTGHAIYQLVYVMIKDWGLESKVMCDTFDNATNNDSIIMSRTMIGKIPLATCL